MQISLTVLDSKCINIRSIFNIIMRLNIHSICKMSLYLKSLGRIDYMTKVLSKIDIINFSNKIMMIEILENCI